MRLRILLCLRTITSYKVDDLYMFTIFERDHKQSEKDILQEFPNSQFVMRVDRLLDNEGYLLAVSTSPESSSEFGDYLAQHRHLRFLSVGGCYGVDFVSVY